MPLHSKICAKCKSTRECVDFFIFFVFCYKWSGNSLAMNQFLKRKTKNNNNKLLNVLVKDFKEFLQKKKRVDNRSLNMKRRVVGQVKSTDSYLSEMSYESFVRSIIHVSLPIERCLCIEPVACVCKS